MIAWNFMEELCRKYKAGGVTKPQISFKLKDFNYFDLFEEYLQKVGVNESDADNVILHVLKEYENKGYFRISENGVTLTEKGLEKCDNSTYDWD